MVEVQYVAYTLCKGEIGKTLITQGEKQIPNRIDSFICFFFRPLNLLYPTEPLAKSFESQQFSLRAACPRIFISFATSPSTFLGFRWARAFQKLAPGVDLRVVKGLN